MTVVPHLGGRGRNTEFDRVILQDQRWTTKINKTTKLKIKVNDSIQLIVHCIQLIV